MASTIAPAPPDNGRRQAARCRSQELPPQVRACRYRGWLSSMASALLLATGLMAGLPALAGPDRALAAMAAEQGGVYLSWRLLPEDPPAAAFDVYRAVDGQYQRLNSQPIWRTTDFIDADGKLDQHDWFVERRGSGERSAAAFKAQQGNAFLVPNGYNSHGRNLGVADFDGDGRLDFVMRHSSFTTDPYHRLWRPSPSKYSLLAFTQAGEVLWRYDMGAAIEMGIWYSPYVVYDLDGDGKAELVVKAGDESLPAERMRDASGRVVHGPEYLRVISGEDGATVLASAPWPSRHGFGKGDSAGTPAKLRRYEDYNRWSRNFIAIAYLDGRHPHVIVNRGTYGKHKVRAYRYLEGQLQLVWQWENVDPADGGDPNLWGQGAHTLQAHDVDGDGRDEVVIGALILDDDGQPLRHLGHGHREHLDHVYIGDLDPLHIGLEMYYGAEYKHSGQGIGMIDIATGRTLWAVDWNTRHIHANGMCADIDPRHPGIECYSGEADRSAYWLHSAQGALISDTNLAGLSPKTVWWDADAQKEVVRSSPDKAVAAAYLSKFPENQLLWPLPTPASVGKKDREEQRIIAILDLLGDWREEVIVADRGRLVIHMSNLPATGRNPWLMRDRTYRLGVINASTGYYQQPMYSQTITAEAPPMGPVAPRTYDCRPIAVACFPTLH